MSKKTAVVTDSNSGITQPQAVQYGISVVPMPFTIGDETYYEGINISQAEFYQKLSDNISIYTSQPSAGDLFDLWDKLLEDYEEVVYIPMSSALSSSYQTAVFLATDYDGRVQVVDNRRISVPMKQSVLDAKTLADEGWGALRIKEELERVKFESSIYIIVDTLKYLKKGGRVTPAAAALGSLVNIKPVLKVLGDKPDFHAKALGMNQAKSILIDAMRKDFDTRFAGYSDPERMWLEMAYTYDEDAATEFKSEVEEAFPGYEIVMDAIPLSMACHIGPGAIGIGCSKKLDCL